MALNNGERIVISEEKIYELEKSNRETNKVLRRVSTQVNSLCVSQAKIAATLDGLTEKVDDLKESYKEGISKTDYNKIVCDTRYQEVLKSTSYLATKQKIIYAVASLISAGVISIVVKMIVI